MTVKLQHMTDNTAALVRFAISNLMYSDDTPANLALTKADIEELRHVHSQITLQLQANARKKEAKKWCTKPTR